MNHDPGLGRERTGLAWQRMALSLLLVSAVLLRLRYADPGPGALVGAGGAFVLAAWVIVENRARLVGRSLDRGRGGRSAVALSAATAALAVTELAVLTDD